jgi:hypothetical protein
VNISEVRFDAVITDMCLLDGLGRTAARTGSNSNGQNAVVITAHGSGRASPQPLTISPTRGFLQPARGGISRAGTPVNRHWPNN